MEMVIDMIASIQLFLLFLPDIQKHDASPTDEIGYLVRYEYDNQLTRSFLKNKIDIISFTIRGSC